MSSIIFPLLYTPALSRHPLLSPCLVTLSCHPVLSPSLVTLSCHPVSSPSVVTLCCHPLSFLCDISYISPHLINVIAISPLCVLNLSTSAKKEKRNGRTRFNVVISTGRTNPSNVDDCCVECKFHNIDVICSDTCLIRLYPLISTSKPV